MHVLINFKIKNVNNCNTRIYLVLFLSKKLPKK